MAQVPINGLTANLGLAEWATEPELGALLTQIRRYADNSPQPVTRLTTSYAGFKTQHGQFRGKRWVARAQTRLIGPPTRRQII